MDAEEGNGDSSISSSALDSSDVCAGLVKILRSGVVVGWERGEGVVLDGSLIVMVLPLMPLCSGTMPSLFGLWGLTSILGRISEVVEVVDNRWGSEELFWVLVIMDLSLSGGT